MTETDSIRPLTWPSTGQPSSTLFERCCMWVPLVGWLAGAMSWGWRAVPVAIYIDGQIVRRPPIGEEHWQGDARRREFGRWLSTIIAKEIGWAHDRFIEGDPMEILCWAHDDGLDVEFLIQRIEERIGRRLATAECVQLLAMTLGDSVDYLLSSQKEAACA